VLNTKGFPLRKMKWTFAGVFAAFQFLPLICGVRNSQQTIHDHLQSELLLPVQRGSHVVYEGSGDTDVLLDKTPVYKVTEHPPPKRQPGDISNSATGHQSASVVVLHKPSPAIIVLIVILILLLITALLAIGYLWRRVRVLKERLTKPSPTKGEFDEDEYSVMMDWSVK
uniref:Uncharacterized protein n=2 Tax=Magallana gigas TaxID=29159 RepID=A0A8W8LRX6_MAGGI